MSERKSKSVSKARVFLAGSPTGFSRAEQTPGGGWEVDRLRADLKATCLAEDPLNPGVLFAGTRSSGVWRSKDRGRSWEYCGLKDQMVMSLAVSPHPQAGDLRVQPLLYAGAKPALTFRSGDGGKSWEELGGFRRVPNRWWWFSPADPPGWKPYVISIAPSPADPNVILAGVEFGGVMRSDDRGGTWSRHLSGALRDCHDLKFHPAKGTWVYQAGGTGGGASFSRDGGITWHKAKHGLAANYGIACAADPEKPEVWYLSVAKSPGKAHGESPETYLYRATAGAGWQPIGWSAQPLSETPFALVTRQGAPGNLWFGGRNGAVWHSPDYGASWEKLPFNLGAGASSLLVLD